MTAPKLPLIPRLFHIVSFSGAKAQDEEWLSEDVDYTNENSFPTERNVVLRLSFASTLAAVIEITKDSGTTWTKINNGDTVLGEVIFDIVISKTTQFNIRTPTVGGTTVVDGKVSFALGEG